MSKGYAEQWKREHGGGASKQPAQQPQTLSLDKKSVASAKPLWEKIHPENKRVMLDSIGILEEQGFDESNNPIEALLNTYVEDPNDPNDQGIQMIQKLWGLMKQS